MAAQTGRMPKALQDRPKLTDRQSHFYGIYNELAQSREISQVGALPLGIDKLRHYVDYFQIRRLEEREEIFTFVGALDEVYCEVVNARKTEADKAG